MRSLGLACKELGVSWNKMRTELVSGQNGFLLRCLGFGCGLAEKKGFL